MSDGILTFEHGEVTLAGKLVPGILKSQSIGCSVRFDEAEQDGVSGKVKTPLGWDDSDISLTLDLLTDEESNCYEKLAALNAVFKGHDNGGNPKVYEISNPHIIARGVHQVVFAGLDSEESDGDDIISASLKFTEHEPPIQKVEKQGSAPGGSTPTNKTGEPDPDKDVVEDEPNAFVRGFLDGSGQS